MAHMRLMLTGAGGQLGRELTRAMDHLGKVTALDRSGPDVTDAETVRSLRLDVEVNAAVYTAVDQAGSGPDLAHAINARAPGLLADTAVEAEAFFVHLSTDYVFEGTASTPISEVAATNPPGGYRETKLAGEQAIQQAEGSR